MPFKIKQKKFVNIVNNFWLKVKKDTNKKKERKEAGIYRYRLPFLSYFLII